MNKYVGAYRVKQEYGLNTVTGEYEFSDIDATYIDCRLGNQIYRYKGDILCAYIPSKGRGRNIVKAIEEFNKNIIHNIKETDSEVEIFFDEKFISTLAELCNAKVDGKNINPRSKKNLPKEKLQKYDFKDESLYREFTGKIIQYAENSGLPPIRVYIDFYKKFDELYGLEIKKLAKEELLKPIHYIDKHYGMDKAIIVLNLLSK